MAAGIEIIVFSCSSTAYDNRVSGVSFIGVPKRNKPFLHSS